MYLGTTINYQNVSKKIQNIEDTQNVQLKDIDIEQNNLTHEQIEKVKALLDKNSDIFCKK
jgi:hypothetical protein